MFLLIFFELSLIDAQAYVLTFMILS